MAYNEENFGNFTLTESLVFVNNTQQDNYAFCQVSGAREEFLKSKISKYRKLKKTKQNSNNNNNSSHLFFCNHESLTIGSQKKQC